MARGFSSSGQRARARRNYRGGDLEALLQAQARGELERAEQGYRQLWAKGFEDPRIPAALAAIAAQRGSHGEVLHWLEQAVALSPEAPHLQFNLGMACLALEQWHKAHAAFTAQLRLQPRSAEGQYGLAMALQGLARSAEALDAAARAVQLQPLLTPAQVLQAELRAALGAPERAEQDLLAAVQLQPQQVELWQALNALQSSQGLLPQALQSAQRALELQPHAAISHHNLANVLRDLGRTDEALQHYGLALRDSCGPVASSLEAQARLLNQLARSEEAWACWDRYWHQRAEELEAPAAQLTMVRHLQHLEALPPVYASEQQLLRLRQAADDELTASERLLQQGEPAQWCGPLILELLCGFSGFARAYQQHDDRDYQQRLAQVLRQLLLANLEPWQEQRPPDRSADRPEPRRPLRLGIASACLHNHNGAYWALGWLEALDPGRFDCVVYALEQPVPADRGAARFRALGEQRALPMTPATLSADISQIQADRLDVLLLPEVGMRPSSRLLSLLRLAPLQLTSWGHPITTGSPAMDGFLSGELMEPAAGQNHYSETLHRLPNLGFRFELPPPPDPGALPPLERVFADSGEPCLLVGCVQSLFKLLPRFDPLYADLVASCPQVKLIFLADRRPAVTAVFVERLGQLFKARGLDVARHVQILDRLPEAAFNALFEQLDLNLDSPGWSGGNTTLRALRSGCPTLSWQGPLMRARHTAAMLHRINQGDLVVTAPEQLVPRAAALLADPAGLRARRSRIAAGSAALFDDDAAAGAFQALLLEASAHV